MNPGSDKHVSPNKELKKESVIEAEEVDISEGIQDENENENNMEGEDKNTIPKQVIDQVAAAIGEKWNVLAEKLGYQPDEVTIVFILIIFKVLLRLNRTYYNACNISSGVCWLIIIFKIIQINSLIMIICSLKIYNNSNILY